MIKAIVKNATAIHLMLIFCFVYAFFGTNLQANVLLVALTTSILNAIALGAYFANSLENARGDLSNQATMTICLINTKQTLFRLKKIEVKSWKKIDNIFELVCENYCLAEYLFVGFMSVLFFAFCVIDYESMTTGFRGEPFKYALGLAFFSVCMAYILIHFWASYFFGFFSQLKWRYIK
jgi:hypothetical protein